MGNYVVDLKDRVSKQVCVYNKMQRFKWVLEKVIEDHGHTITLIEAALLAETYPERYDYDAYVKQTEKAEFDDFYNHYMTTDLRRD